MAREIGKKKRLMCGELYLGSGRLLLKMACFIPLPLLPFTAVLVHLGNCHVYGIPRHIVLDHAVHFISCFWKGLLKSWNISLKFLSAYHTQTIGQAERINQSLEQYFYALTSAHNHDWVAFLSWV